MKNKIIFSKLSYSEKVLRKALYWLSEDCCWELNETDDNWLVLVHEESEEMFNTAELNRLINDFKLRELLDIETKELRINLIKSAFQKIINHG